MVGVMIGSFHLRRNLLPRWVLPPLAGAVITFIGVHLAWVPFRVAHPLEVLRIWHGMSGLNGLSQGLVSLPDLVFLALVTLSTLLLPNAAERWPGRSGWAESVLLYAVALFAVFNTPEIVQFIYFQF